MIAPTFMAPSHDARVPDMGWMLPLLMRYSFIDTALYIRVGTDVFAVSFLKRLPWARARSSFVVAEDFPRDLESSESSMLPS